MVNIDRIKTERLMLRCIDMNDCANVCEILQNEVATKYLNIDKITDIEDAKRLVVDYLEGYKNGTKFPFAITSRQNDEFIGVFLIKLDLFDEDCFEFTVYINPKFWNRGIYSEVLPYMTQFAFEKVGTGNFRGFVMEQNKASSKVLLKSGFIHEKTFHVEGIEGMIESYLLTLHDYCNGDMKNETNI